MRIRVKKIYYLYSFYLFLLKKNYCKKIDFAQQKKCCNFFWLTTINAKNLFGEKNIFFFNQKKIRGRCLKKIAKICATWNLQVAGNFLQGFARC